MKVILLKEISGLGREFDVIEVKDGYARNYLIPKRMAIRATPANLAGLEHRKRLIERKRAKALAQAQQIAEKLTGASIKTSLKVGEGDKVFGSITTGDISELLKLRRKVEVDHRQIKLTEPIRTPGVYTIPIQLHPDLTVEIKLWVVRERVAKK
ncbi:50S ribosomal protein L9 [candidate division WOR-3 bacterium]|uniref:Large ribosomal subunit protein bL9 n=1 Tax=candidate division WOR-3 bacterium TaxID=2052148 RepID=A0A660SDA2_UNCW3|nr:MAG: 50S ribosomal protein L9 [candidate division WOR-3 bacterium]